jgi:hypothetical protein
MTKRMIVPASRLRMAPQSSALPLRSSLDACITSLSERQLVAPSSASTASRCKSIARSRRFSSELSQAKLFCFISIHSVGRMQYQEIAFAMCADGQFDDARCNITLVTSFTIVLGNAVNYARVTDFRCEATGQISDVVAREAAKQIPSESFKSNGYFHGATRSSSRGGLTRCRRPRVVASLLILFT